ncbi:tRNA (N6-isopentenyl adenosine(37)-C2)-methylthiotransferase MiaB [Gammaproteobacteria bacterium]|nr:tRNA (N6-isopentenyl adenosine(37)-C2)-methylthiotransferase MiaB [Gammaproteobacteria bacterium]
MRVFIKTYGCQMNSYDSEKMMNVLKEQFSATLSDNVESADLLILNTCSIREKAQEKVFSELGRWKTLKKKRPEILIGVAGCVASQEGDAILKRVPIVDFVIGPQTIHRIADLIRSRNQDGKRQVDISFPKIEKFDHLPRTVTSNVSAHVSIMEGCNKYCSFCIVPYTRGEEVSRPFKAVIKEIVSLTEQGVKEVNLLGQNVNDYYGQLDQHTGDLALLIHYVSAIPGMSRIRFTTSHPKAFTNRLIDAYAEEPKLVSHLHFPVQSGSNRILSAMKRGYTREEYLKKVDQIRLARPDITFSSDFIVGFPGESESDFQDTLDLIDAVQFDISFSFIYSPRPGTPAASLPDDVSFETKQKRLKILQDKLAHYAQQHALNMRSKVYKVLVEGVDKRTGHWLKGRTENNRVVLFHGPKEVIGQLAYVQIREIHANTLRGQFESLCEEELYAHS